MKRTNTAEYFATMLSNYSRISKESKKYWSGYTNWQVEIHHAGDEFMYYTIYKNGRVTKHFLSDSSLAGVEVSMDELTGNDFELFNTIQITRTGYLMLESNITPKEAISNLFFYIDENEWDCDKRNDGESHKCPALCGGAYFKDNLTSCFSYLSTSESELELQTIPELKRRNSSRVFYGIHPMPYIKNLDSRKAIYIPFINSVYGEKASDYGKMKETIAQNDEESRIELMEMLCDCGIKAVWEEVPLKGYLYE